MEITSGMDTEVSEISCLDTYLQYDIMAEICRRGISDIPLGCLPQTLDTLETWTRAVKYQLLPRLRAHEHLARLVAVVCCFDALHSAESGSSGADQR